MLSRAPGGSISATGDLVLTADSDASGAGDVTIYEGTTQRLIIKPSGGVGIGDNGGSPPPPDAFHATLALVPVADSYKGIQIRGRATQTSSLLRVESTGGTTQFLDVAAVGTTTINFVKTNAAAAMNGLTVIVTESGVNTGNTGGVSVTVTTAESTPDEPVAIYAKLAGSGTARLWLMDTKVYGPTATQANLILGKSILMVNRNASAVSGGGAVGQHVVTERKNEGEIVDVTYPIDVGLLINGRSGDVADTNQGFVTGIQIGGTGSGGWQPGASRIGTGVHARDYETVGLLIDNAFANGAVGAQIKASGTQTGNLLETYKTSGTVSVQFPAAGGMTSNDRITVATTGTAKISLDNTAGLMIRAAALEQTTVGAAGGASALPATPTKYIKIQDSTGATLVIPAYAAV